MNCSILPKLINYKNSLIMGSLVFYRPHNYMFDKSFNLTGKLGIR
jgi:hypothetical protein